jgi:hypothetical protein
MNCWTQTCETLTPEPNLKMQIGDYWRNALIILVMTCCASLWPTKVQAGTIAVDRPAEFADALAVAKGGDIIQLGGGEPYELVIKSREFEPAITITSDAVGEPATAARISLFDSRGVKVTKTNIRPKAGTNRDKAQVLHIVRSRDVTISENTAIGSASEYLTPANKDRAVGENFSLIRWSDGVTLEKNVISGFLHGIGVLETTNLRIIGNEITKLQGDGIRMGGVRGLEISDNRIHGFLGSDQSVNHSDMIQLWSTNADIISGNIKIARNRLLSGDGPATQSIFMRNEQADQNPSAKGRYYSNISIIDNLIHNGHLHGITVGETNGVTIRNNTLLPNAKSTMGEGGERKMYPPMIVVAKTSTGVVIESNVTSGISAPTPAPLAANYVYAKEEWKRNADLARLYYATSFNGALPDKAYFAKPGTVVERKNLGSILTSKHTATIGKGAAPPVAQTSNGIAP